jgi:uncharacterized protein
MDLVLTPVEARVLASLIEKEATTPDYYPLTRNAVLAACNQKSNRDPVMALTEADVGTALEELRYQHHLVWEVTLTGNRVPKYKHDIGSSIDLDDLEQAILCELMLRGPQTVGELRTRSQRLCGEHPAGEITATLEKLAERPGGAVVARLAPGHGKREPRYAHLLCGSAAEDVPGEEATEDQDAAPRLSPMQQRIADLEGAVTSLRGELQALRTAFEEFKQQFE